MKDFVIVANYKKDILVGKFQINNPEILDKIANELLGNLPAEKVKQTQNFSLSIILKGLLGNPEPKSKRQKFVYEILKENDLEELWNEFTKEVLKNDETGEYKALKQFHELMTQKIIEFKTINTISMEDLKKGNYTNIITKNNATTIFRNGNILFPKSSYIRLKIK